MQHIYINVVMELTVIIGYVITCAALSLTNKLIIQIIIIIIIIMIISDSASVSVTGGGRVAGAAVRY